MPEKQPIVDMVAAGIAGSATSILHKLKSGVPVTPASIAIDAGLAVCSMVLAYIVCDMMGLSQENARFVYFGAGWLGSRVIAIVEKNADSKIEKAIDKLTDKL